MLVSRKVVVHSGEMFLMVIFSLFLGKVILSCVCVTKLSASTQKTFSFFSRTQKLAGQADRLSRRLG